MKYIILIAILASAVQTSAKGFILQGKVTDAIPNSSKVFLYYEQPQGYVIDSAEVVDFKFSFSGNLDPVTMAMLTIENLNDTTDEPRKLYFFLENSSIELQVNSVTDTLPYVVKGSRTHQLHLELLERLKPLQIKMNDLSKMQYKVTPEIASSPAFLEKLRFLDYGIKSQNTQYIYDFINEHQTEEFCLVLLQSVLRNDPNDLQVQIVFNSFPLELQHSKLGLVLKQEIEDNMRLSLGKQAPDFEIQDINGNQFRLSTLRGKNVLLIFWSIDCHFCLEEIVSLKGLIKNSKSKDLELVFISEDEVSKRDRWEEFVRTHEVPGFNILDTRMVDNEKKLGTLYRIQRTPSNLLLNKNGQIIMKDAYGEELIRRVSTIVRLSKVE